jgi:hypothetical protein
MIPIETARQRAIDRITAALQERLGQSLTLVTDPVALPLPIPGNDAYYCLGADWDDAITNRQQAVYVYDSSPREVIERYSGGATTRGMLTRFNVNVVMMFKIAMHEPIVRNGKVMTKEDVLRLRAERYTGAIIHCLYRFARNSDAIHDIDLIDDQATIQQPADKHIIGLAVTRFSVSQKVTVPQADFGPLPVGVGFHLGLQGNLG